MITLYEKNKEYVEIENSQKNTNPRSQTTYKESETEIYEDRQDVYVSGTEEKDLLMIYTRFTRVF